MRKLFVLILTAALVYTLAVPASAASGNNSPASDIWGAIDPGEEIQRALNGITDVEFDKIQGQATATAIAKDGSEQACPVDVYVTTRKIGCPLAAVDLGDGQPTTYATTAVAVLSSSDKSVTDSKEKGYVTATVTIYWRDNTGIANELLSVSGGWTRSKNPETGTYPYLTNRYVYLYANQAQVGPTDKHIDISSNTFYIDGDEMPSNYWSYSATSYVDIYDSSSDVNDSSVDPITLRLKVSTPFIG